MNKTNHRLVSFLILLTSVGVPGLVPAQTNYPFKLNGTLAEDGDVRMGAEFSPDGSRVVYLADQDTDGTDELYSVPIVGGAPVKLNGSLPDPGIVLDFQISPDGSQVVYRATQIVSGLFELFSVPIGGGIPVKLNGRLVLNGDVQPGYQVSPDGSRVIYLADQDADEQVELYSVPIGGGIAVQLNGTLVTFGNVFDFEISPDSSRVVYLATQDQPSTFELFSVVIEGGLAVQLNGTLAFNGDVKPGFQISPDSRRVVYRADQDAQNVDELYSVGIGGRGSLVKLNGPLVTGGNVLDFEISPEGSRVVYQADQSVDFKDELYSVPILGGIRDKLNGELGTNGDVFSFEISPDGSRVVYRADQDQVPELYLVSIEGGVEAKLNGELGPNRSVSSFKISPDGKRVVYGDLDTAGVIELYSVPIGGGGTVKLNGPLIAGGEVRSGYQISADGSRVVYLADQDTFFVDELYSASIEGGGSVKLNGNLAVGGDVEDFQISPDGNQVIYRADQDSDEVFELFVGRAQAIWESSGGSWFVSANWRDGVRPNQTVEAVVTVPAVVQISSSAAPVVAESLVLGGGSGRSVVELLDGTALTLELGAQILADGVVRGDGVLSVGSLPLALPAGAELRAGDGEHLEVQSGEVTNAGRIEALGTAAQPAEVELAGEVTNSAGSGAILGHNAIFRFPHGVVNEGSLSFGGGINDVLGDLSNESGGLMAVSGGAIALFNEDVTNGGMINVSAAGGLQSTAVFFGALSGNGVSGGGHVFLEGDMRPGFSAGTMAFGGDLSYGPFASMEIEIGGTTPSSGHDQVTVAGHLELNGTLNVTLLSPFVPSAGDSFDLWEAGSVSGAFHTINLPALPAGLFWHRSEVNTTGLLRVGCVPDSYPAFAAYHGLLGGPHDDDDGDNLSNVLEYVFALNPTVSQAPVGLPTISWNGGNDEFAFTLTSPIGPEVSLVIETSTDLANWTDLATRSGNGPWTGAVTETPGAPCKVQVLLTNPTSPPRRFYRIGASLAP